MARIRPGAERKQEEEAKSSSEALRVGPCMPRRIVVAGSLAEDGRPWGATMCQAVEEGVRWPTQPTPQEEPSCLGEGARQATSAAQVRGGRRWLYWWRFLTAIYLCVNDGRCAAATHSTRSPRGQHGVHPGPGGPPEPPPAQGVHVPGAGLNERRPTTHRRALTWRRQVVIRVLSVACFAS